MSMSSKQRKKISQGQRHRWQRQKRIDSAKDKVVAAAREVALVGHALAVGDVVKIATSQELGQMMRELRGSIKELDDALASN